MKRRLAHGMRRAAHALIAGSNRLDPPVEALAPGATRAAEIGAQLAARAVQYGNESAAAFVEAMVADGEAASKGEARRKLGYNHLDLVEVDGKTWHDRLLKGIAGQHPGLQ